MKPKINKAKLKSISNHYIDNTNHFPMRLLFVFVGLAGLVLLTFFLFGSDFTDTFTHEGSVAWLSRYGAWAWSAGIALLASDLLLPLPATIIMSALGYLYGTLWGGLISAAGSFVAGAAGYWLCRLAGEKAAMRILGRKDYDRAKRMSHNVGGWLVVLSRWLPVFPEAIACIAGLTRMPAGYFHLALACGSLPLGFIYAWIGHTGVTQPVLALLFSACVPPLIWFFVRRAIRRWQIA